MSPPGILSGLLGLAIVVLIPVITALGLFLLGGCRAGRMRREVEVKLRLADLPQFQERLLKRLVETGFTSLADDGTYLQGSTTMPVTHADKKKSLTIDTDISRPEETRVNIRGSYLDLIIADSGEAAYLEALLAYVSGKTDELKVAPTRMFLGMVTVVEGIAIGLACYYLTFEQVQKWWFAIVIVGVCNTISGFQVIQAIRKSGGKLKGRWEAWAGATLGIIGMALALIPVLKAELLEFIHRFQ